MSPSDDEIIPEEAAEEGDPGQAQALVQKLREKLKKAVEEKQEYLEGWQRSRADFANFKKEEARMALEREMRLRAEFAESIIPALDSFEMAFRTPSFDSASPDWKNGITSVYRELIKSLEKFGVTSFSPRGEKFDPLRHEAVREVEAEESKDHTVVSVERSGYAIGEQVIRPAQVSIGRFKGA